MDVRDFENKIVLYYVIGSFDIVKEIFKVSINLLYFNYILVF